MLCRLVIRFTAAAHSRRSNNSKKNLKRQSIKGHPYLTTVTFAQHQLQNDNLKATVLEVTEESKYRILSGVQILMFCKQAQIPISAIVYVT